MRLSREIVLREATRSRQGCVRVGGGGHGSGRMAERRWRRKKAARQRRFGYRRAKMLLVSKTGHIRRDCPDLAGFKGYKCALASLAQQKGGGTAAEGGNREEIGLGLSAQSVEVTRPQAAKERTTVNRPGKGGGRTRKDQTMSMRRLGSGFVWRR